MKSSNLDSTLRELFSRDIAIDTSTEAAFDSAFDAIRRSSNTAPQKEVNMKYTDKKINLLTSENKQSVDKRRLAELAAAAVIFVLAAGILVFSLAGRSKVSPDTVSGTSAPMAQTETIPTERNTFHYTRPDGVEVYCITRDTISEISQEELDEYECRMYGWRDAEELHANVTDEHYREVFTKEAYLTNGLANTPTSDEISADRAVDFALNFLQEYFPDNPIPSTFVKVHYGKLDDPDLFCGDIWIIEHLDQVSSIYVDAMTGEIVFPTRVG